MYQQELQPIVSECYIGTFENAMLFVQRKCRFRFLLSLYLDSEGEYPDTMTKNPRTNSKKEVTSLI